LAIGEDSKASTYKETPKQSKNVKLFGSRESSTLCVIMLNFDDTTVYHVENLSASASSSAYVALQDQIRGIARIRSAKIMASRDPFRIHASDWYKILLGEYDEMDVRFVNFNRCAAIIQSWVRRGYTLRWKNKETNYNAYVILPLVFEKRIVWKITAYVSYSLEVRRSYLVAHMCVPRMKFGLISCPNYLVMAADNLRPQDNREPVHWTDQATHGVEAPHTRLMRRISDEYFGRVVWLEGKPRVPYRLSGGNRRLLQELVTVQNVVLPARACQIIQTYMVPDSLSLTMNYIDMQNDFLDRKAYEKLVLAWRQLTRSTRNPNTNEKTLGPADYYYRVPLLLNEWVREDLDERAPRAPRWWRLAHSDSDSDDTSSSDSISIQ